MLRKAVEVRLDLVLARTTNRQAVVPGPAGLAAVDQPRVLVAARQRDTHLGVVLQGFRELLPSLDTHLVRCGAFAAVEKTNKQT